MKHKIFWVLVAGLLLMSTAVVAKNLPTVTPVGPQDLPVRVLSPAADGQQVGNLNPPAWRLSGWFTGMEEYKYLFNPVEQLNCAAGFQLTQVHMVLDFADTLVYPVTFPVWVDLEDASWDGTRQCWAPGIEDCVSDIYNITIDQPGMYDIAVPIDCGCAYMTDPTGLPYMYLLSMHFPELFEASIITDDFPAPCTSWNNWGEGWSDLVSEYGFPGNILMWGDVVCCANPVDAETESWGSIKSLFR